MSRAAVARIDLGAFRHNLLRARQAAPHSKVLAVIKSNAYGHGILNAAKALNAADGFAVAVLDEAIRLREAGVFHRILLLQGVVDEAELKEAAEHKLDLTVHHEDQVALLENARLTSPLRVWVKIDSGMHRLGLAPERAVEIAQRLQACANVGEINWSTHFANADDRADPKTTEQLTCFGESIEKLPGQWSAANSGGILGWPDSHGDWIRPGIMLYGVSPFHDAQSDELDLRPVMTFSSRLSAVKPHKQGEPVGYSGIWRAERDTTIGVVSVGYGDGFPRLAPAGTPVWVNGRIAPMAGRVSMDMITVDLGPDAQDRVGDIVQLWGPDLPVEAVASHIGTIGYELLAGLSPRPRYEIVDS